MDDLLVRARQLTVTFAQGNGFVHAVNGVDFDLHQREVLCILGESGSGKSVTLRALMRLNPPTKTIMSGTLNVGGHNVVSASERQMSSLRGPFVSMIFQDPMTSLDPVFTIGQQITETIMRHEHIGGSEARKRAVNLLELVQIPSPGRRLDAWIGQGRHDLLLSVGRHLAIAHKSRRLTVVAHVLAPRLPFLRGLTQALAKSD
jgi:peptide/nickel transport system ATP-binding protein